MYASLVSPHHVACSNHLILIDFKAPLKRDEVWNLWSSSLWSFFQPPVKLSLIFSSILCSQTPSVCVLPLMWEAKLYAHATDKIIVFFFCVFSSFCSLYRRRSDNRFCTEWHCVPLVLMFTAAPQIQETLSYSEDLRTVLLANS